MKKIRIVTQIIFLIFFSFVIVSGNMVLWLGVFLLSLLGAAVFGRFYCGYICPMNTAMGVTANLAKRLNWQTKSVPKVLKSKILPWMILALMIATMIVSKRVLQLELPILLILMVLSIVITLRYEEWVFHNHVCPYGALLSLTGKGAKFSTKVDSSLCIGCKKCEKVCSSMAVKMEDISKVAKIDSALCHQCQACTIICPTKAIRYTKSS
ncbi:4Fe-4S binding protein [Petrocella sp. FN5]|uniref:4Fe-4S binding protein n=1 Tax=Petrocella sp. FN5 TaxID=3032002 RepID=UPI0023DA4080|nr:4Fe-4S binding protein [Petrocella sp. FN5]MDF1617482.1 4Fe-4S binding protein [Petrocella sp. FN5]